MYKVDHMLDNDWNLELQKTLNNFKCFRRLVRRNSIFIILLYMYFLLLSTSAGYTLLLLRTNRWVASNAAVCEATDRRSVQRILLPN